MLLYAAGNKTDLHCTFKTNDTANVMDILKLLCSINGTSSYNNLKLVVIIYTHKICLNSAATIKAQNQLKFCINYIILPKWLPQTHSSIHQSGLTLQIGNFMKAITIHSFPCPYIHTYMYIDTYNLQMTETPLVLIYCTLSRH